MRALQVGQRAGSRVDGGQRVDQHDLPVEAGEVIAEERLDDVGLVALEAARQHGAEAAAPIAGRRPRRQREEREQGRAGEIARQQEAARSRRRQLGVGRARGLQVAREEIGARERGLLVGRRIGVERGQVLPASPRAAAARCGARASATARRRPVGERLVQQRQVDQPFAGIVDDVDVQAARPELRAAAPWPACIRW